MNAAPIISKVWSFCNTLRDDGVGNGDYLEQLTYLIFLKLADEYGKPPYSRNVGIPAEYAWPSLTLRNGAALESHHASFLRELGTKPDMLGQIFIKAQNKIQYPPKLYRLIAMVDDPEWVTMGADIQHFFWPTRASTVGRMLFKMLFGAGNHVRLGQHTPCLLPHRRVAESSRRLFSATVHRQCPQR